jgi:mannitol/fructose-specific phosphotransferase system IIA component (Ntr-type)
MKLSDYLTLDRVVMLKSGTKIDAIDEMTGVLIEGIDGISRRELTEHIHKREDLMSTGIGFGIAVPHVRMEGLDNAALTVGVSRNGIADYETIDGDPVHIIVLIVAPQGRHDLYIKLLARVVTMLKDSSIRSRIIEGADSRTVYSILTGGDE